MNPQLALFGLRRNIDSLAAGVAGFCIIFLFTRHSGIGVSPDSINYLSAARNLAAGQGLTQYDQSPLIDFPALYPVFLRSIAAVSGLDPLIFLPVLNGLLFFALLYISGSLMNGFLPVSMIYKRIMLSCFVMSPCLLEVYPMLWSETVFLPLVLLFILTLAQYLRSHSVQSLLLCAAITALACVTRYVGITLLGTGLVLIFADRASKFTTRIAHGIIFYLAGLSLLLANMLRNRVVAGFFAGNRQKGVTPLLDNISYYGGVLCEWLPLPKTENWFSLAVGLISIIFFLVLIVQYIKPQRPLHTCETVGTVFCLVYSVFILFSATVSRYQQLNSRLLAPFFIPFLWTLTYWVPGFIKSLSRGRGVMVFVFSVIVFLAFQYNQLAADWESYDGIKDAGIPGYTEDPFPQSQLVRYIKGRPFTLNRGEMIYSNAADAVYFFSGLSAMLLPEKIFPAHVDQFYALAPVYLVWFNEIDNPDLPGIQEIINHKKMSLVARFPEGAVYRAAAK